MKFLETACLDINDIRLQLAGLSARLADIDKPTAANIEVARDALADAESRARSALNGTAKISQ